MGARCRLAPIRSLGVTRYLGFTQLIIMLLFNHCALLALLEFPECCVQGHTDCDIRTSKALWRDFL